MHNKFINERHFVAGQPTTRFAQAVRYKGVEAVERPVGNFAVGKTEAESAMKSYWQRFMTLIFAYRCLFWAKYLQNHRLYVFLRPRYALKIEE